MIILIIIMIIIMTRLAAAPQLPLQLPELHVRLLPARLNLLEDARVDGADGVLEYPSGGATCLRRLV